MKNLFWLILFIFFSCSPLKNANSVLKNSYYICYKGEMVGNTIIYFKDSTFVYSERGGLFEGYGDWDLTHDGKIIKLNGVYKKTKGDLNNKKGIDLELTVKGKEKLIGDGCVFYKIKNHNSL